MNILLLCGGGGAEHDISLLSAQYFEACLAQRDDVNLLYLTLNAQGEYHTKAGQKCELTNRREIRFEDDTPAWQVDYVIPCIHGYPGETGDIQSYFNLINLPYFGCESEASSNCFNKITAKMWFSALDIPNTPYLFVNQLDEESIKRCEAAFDKWGSLFVKAASQGSSVGCFKVDQRDEIGNILAQAFRYSPYVIVEKTIRARELEVAVYQYQGEVIATKPGEIICADNTFYSFEEKYADNSHATTQVEATNLSDEQISQIQEYAVRAFKGLKLRHLSRIDFFLSDEGEILLNEINTFPGLTKISMFPKMLAHHGEDFTQYLMDNIKRQLTQ
ncbi:D-alanine--D-alanine ligase [Shewanella avicenniae]|uniref:D-alanine--D-alanine ligase n=1 Tax=Shewanella avicenniae TaxID=2814294 RepID=A0ABX7QWY2_9GAMM|nr:D-alanine--D-alanine ligase [Shewanella avicenniae]QSX35456.1 D-alanine--D-alanine ligase [Shewanella avicenniae]